MNVFIYVLLVLFVFSSCQEKSPKKLQFSIPKTMKFLGHKGSGVIGENGNNSLIENTWESIVNAVDLLDGSEVDIQMSADSTLWIFHNHNLLDCENKEVYIGNCSDEKLDSISLCKYANKMLTFEEFIDRSTLQEWKNKTISLDLKLLYNPVLLTRFESSKNLTLFVIEKLEKELAHSSFSVLFEVPTIEQYNLFNEVFKNRVYLVNHQPSADFIKKEKERRTSLSLPFHELNVNNDFFKNQNLQLWTINSPNDFVSSLEFNPKYIQSDNIPMMRFFKDIQIGAAIYNVNSEKHIVGNKVSEFYSLVKRKLPQNNLLVEITSKEKELPDEFILTLSAFDSNNEPVHWEGYELSEFHHPYLFIDQNFLKNKNVVEFTISIWNKSFSKFSGEFQLDFFTIEYNTPQR